jgi:hypothetical protein
MHGAIRNLAALGVACAATGAMAAPAAAREPAMERMSNERTRTVPAWVERNIGVRTQPRMSSRRVGTLRPWTFHGRAETVIVLGRSPGAGNWSYVRYAGLGIRKGWVPTSALITRPVVTTRLVIDRPRRQVRLYRAGRLEFRAAVGIGAPGSPTPRGRTYVRERVTPSSPGGIYGPRAFGLSVYSPWRTGWVGGGQVGIHGTNQPGLIPGRISNGCVRLRNPAILSLARRLPIGTPVDVL